jgi:drug/metabolite transporter (DMT)-like permease
MRWTLWIAFAVLCVLAGSSWVIPVEAAEGLPALEQQGVLFGAVGVIAFLFAGRGLWSRRREPRWVQLAAGFVGFFGAPMVAAEYARGSVPAISRAALFAMVPVVVVLSVAAGDSTGREERGARRFLLPALAGLGGLLLLLPVEFSGSGRGRVMLGVVCGAVVVAGVASVWLYGLLRDVGFAEAVAIAGLANAFFLLGWSAVRGEIVWELSGPASLVSVASLLDGVELLLLLWLLREMLPIRFASRYLLIPLLTVLESYVLMRPGWTVRMVCGTILLAAGAGVLLFWKGREEETMLLLR